MSELIALITIGTALFFVLLCFTPFLLALSMLVEEWRDLAVQLAPWAALPALLLAIFVKDGQSFYFTWGILGAELGIQANGRALLGVTALLWLVAGLFSRSVMAKDDRLHQFLIFFLLCMTGNLGIIVAQDIISFYTFIVLMSFTAYGLVIYRRYDEEYRVRQAGRIYLSFSLLSNMCLLLALLLLVADAPDDLNLASIAAHLTQATYQDAIFSLLLMGFGLKIGVLGLHMCLPIAYRVLPISGIIVMGSAMLYVNVFAWQQLLPLGLITQITWGESFILLGFIGGVYSLLIALTQAHRQSLLAYANISQVGLMLMIIGLGFADASEWSQLEPLLLAFIGHHTLIMGTLFFGNGLMQMRTMPPKLRAWLLGSLLLPVLMLLGAPFTSHAFMLTELKNLSQLSPISWAAQLPMWINFVTILYTIVLTRFIWLCWRTLPHEQAPYLQPILSTAWLLLVFGLLSVSLALQWQHFGLMTINYLWSTTWPILLGIALSLMFIFLNQKQFVKLVIYIPAGDVFWLGRSLSLRITHKLLHPLVQPYRAVTSRLSHKLCPTDSELTPVEASAYLWPSIGVLLLLLGLLAASYYFA